MNNDYDQNKLDTATRESEGSSLFEQKKLIKTILANTPDIFVLKDQKSAYQAVNPAFCRFINMPEEDIIGKTDLDLFPDDEASDNIRDDALVMETCEPLIKDKQVTGCDGKAWLQVIKTPVLNGEGVCEGVLCSVRDISVRKKREEKVNFQNDILQFLADFNEAALHLDPLHVVDIALNMLAERTLCKHMSVALYETDDDRFKLIGAKHKGIDKLGSGHYLDASDTVLSEVIKEAKPRYREDIEKDNTGYLADRLLVSNGLKSDYLVPLIFQGNTIGTVNIGSERIDGIQKSTRTLVDHLAVPLALTLQNARLHEALKRNEFKYKTLFNSAGDAIYFCNREGDFIEVNDVACQHLGYSRDELLKMSPKDIDSPETPPELSENIEKLKERGHIVFERKHLTKGGKSFPVEINARIFKYNDEQVLISVVRDITERKRADKEREKLIVELRDALDNVQTLSDLLPICASCKKIRDDKGYWNQLETYITKHTGTVFSHGVCPECAKVLYPDFDNEKYKDDE